MTCYDLVKKFKNKFSSTVAWRLFQNSRIVEQHINPDEKINYAFVGQKNESPFDFFQTAVVAITDKRLLIGQKRVVWGSKKSLIEIETKITQFMMEEKKKYGKKED